MSKQDCFESRDQIDLSNFELIPDVNVTRIRFLVSFIFRFTEQEGKLQQASLQYSAWTEDQPTWN